MPTDNLQTYIRVITITLIIFVILGYSLFQARNLIQGPLVTITSPLNGAVVTVPLVEIRGIAKNISRIELNNRDIVIDENGHFAEQLLLAPGYTIMSVLAHDRFGRTTRKTLELFYTS